MMKRPGYVHNATQAFIPVQDGSKYSELVYNGQMDVIWEPQSGQAVNRKYLLNLWREVVLRRQMNPFTPLPNGSIVWVGKTALVISRCRPILAICADMRRHIPTARRWK